MTARLPDDCFDPRAALLTHADAITQLRQVTLPVTAAETVALADAIGRAVADTITATMAVPPAPNAAVDGYLFIHGDLAATADGVLPIAGYARAGHPLAMPVVPGHAVRILTGAVVPPGGDTIAMQEDCRVVGRTVQLPKTLKRGANIRQAGEDLAFGDRIVAAGDVLRPQDLAALASVGCAEVLCHRRLTVGIVSSGDELRSPGAGPLGPGQIYDANAVMLAALVSLTGASPRVLGTWSDSRAEVRRRLAEAARDCDVVLTTGGASVGDEDHMGAALAGLGQRHFWRLAIKPGRPMMIGQIDGRPVIGLPGNPVAVLVCFLMYAFPLLRRLGGAAWPEPPRWKVPATFTVSPRKTGRREFWRGTIVPTARGPMVEKFGRDGSGLISSLRAADGLIEIGEDVEAVQQGDLVDFIPFSAFGIAGRS